MIAQAMVVGLGSPDRGDDAVGAVVAERVRAMVGEGVQVLTREDPTALVHAWEGHPMVVLIDSMLSGVPAGTVTVRHAGTRDAPLPTHAFAAAGRGGSHAFGLAGAVELSRTLHTLPEHVVIVGVEAGTFNHGPMSAPVLAALDGAAAAVCRELVAAGVITNDTGHHDPAQPGLTQQGPTHHDHNHTGSEAPTCA